MPDDRTRTSVSAVRSYQQCQQQYYFRYVKRLKKKSGKAPPMAMGIVIHEYLERYYKQLEKGATAPVAHEYAVTKTLTKKWLNEMKLNANLAYMAGANEDAAELLDMPRKARALIDGYYRARGRTDATRYNIITVEWMNETSINERVFLQTHTDLVTEDNETGRVHLWEHKSHKNIPNQNVRLTDLQTLIYRPAIEHDFPEVQVDAVMWNYIRTKEPTVPRVLKAGTMSRDKSIDTTWRVYSEAVVAAGLNPDDYSEMYDILKDKELTEFYERHEQVILATDLLYNDFVKTSINMDRARRAWLAGTHQPIRSVQNSCQWCEFWEICKAAILGGDEADVIKLRFNQRKEEDIAAEDTSTIAAE